MIREMSVDLHCHGNDDNAVMMPAALRNRDGKSIENGGWTPNNLANALERCRAAGTGTSALRLDDRKVRARLNVQKPPRGMTIHPSFARKRMSPMTPNDWRSAFPS